MIERILFYGLFVFGASLFFVGAFLGNCTNLIVGSFVLIMLAVYTLQTRLNSIIAKLEKPRRRRKRRKKKRK
jgi:hypothetical protein